jgi:lipid-binding SYLF domain-containing protein
MKTIWLVAGVTAISTVGWADAAEQNKRIETSAAVLQQFMSSGKVPQELVAKAKCVGIIPSMKQFGVVFGGRHGVGIVTCRVPEGTMMAKTHGVESYGWSAPSTISLSGGSVGAEIGGGSTDILFLVENTAGMQKLMYDKMSFGSDTTAMGPTTPEAAKSGVLDRTETLTWSQSKGLFAGVSLVGSSLSSDRDANESLYGKGVTQQQILTGKAAPPASAALLYELLNKWVTPQKHQ